MQTTFISIFLAGLAFIVVTSLLGGMFGDGDVHVDASADSDGAGGDAHTISIFSPRILAIFCVGFGAAGYLVNDSWHNTLAAILSGAGTGIVFTGLFFFGLRLLHSQQASSDIPTGNAVGQIGVITTDITDAGVGEVGVTVSGQYLTYLCRGKEQYRKGTQVKVTGRAGTYLMVEKINN